MNYKKWVKSIQTAGYNGARTVYIEIVPLMAVRAARGVKIYGRKKTKLTLLVFQTVYFSVAIMCDKLEIQHITS